MLLMFILARPGGLFLYFIISDSGTPESCAHCISLSSVMFNTFWENSVLSFFVLVIFLEDIIWLISG